MDEYDFDYSELEELEDIADSEEEFSMFDDEDETEYPFQIFLTGMTENNVKTGFECRYGCYNNKIDAYDSLDDFFDDDHFEIREKFYIPEDVKILEIQLVKVAQDLFDDDCVLDTRPLVLAD